MMKLYLLLLLFALTSCAPTKNTLSLNKADSLSTTDADLSSATGVDGKKIEASSFLLRHNRLAKIRVRKKVNYFHYGISSINTSLENNSISFMLSQSGMNNGLGTDIPLAEFAFQFLIDEEEERIIFYFDGNSYYEQSTNIEIDEVMLGKEMRKVLDKKLNSFIAITTF